MNEGAALRVLSFINDTSQHHLATLVNEKRKVTVIGEEHEPDEVQEEEPLPPSAVIDTDTDLLTAEQIKEFFKAAEQGAIERLDELFETTTNADPNMTNYTESLLMAAIRAKRLKVAEYLIDQLGVNVNHSTDLLEFRLQTSIPVREHTLSCRDLAYNRGMMNLVDLIDIASDEVKPSIKRYLQRRLKTRLDEIHQAYLKRMKERSHRSVIQAQQKQNQVLEDDELELENIMDDTSLPIMPSIPPIVRRSYKSHIEETIQKIALQNEKSIDITGKKTFRFSGYTLRYRLVDTPSQNQKINEQSLLKPTPFAFPNILLTTTTPLTTPPLSRPMTTATSMNRHRDSINDISTRIPIRETRTPICRSARRATTPRLAPTITSENKSDIKPTITTTINTTQRLLPKRTHQINTTYGYIPQPQHTIYTEPRRHIPVTFKATAIGLPSNSRLIRD